MMLWIKFNPKEVLCDDCRQELGIQQDVCRYLTQLDIDSSVDTYERTDGTEGLTCMEPVCAYCGWKADYEDLPDGA